MGSKIFTVIDTCVASHRYGILISPWHSNILVCTRYDITPILEETWEIDIGKMAWKYLIHHSTT
jgi:hypothetical protein